jgi:hypothetical protein
VTAAALLTPPVLLSATAGLIAFHIGLLTLVGRERQSPYVINSSFSVFMLALAVAAVTVAAALLPGAWSEWLLRLAGWLLVAAILVSLLQVYRIAARFVYFVDSLNPKYLPPISWIRRWKSSGDKPNYRYSTLKVPDSVRADIARGVEQLGFDVPGLDGGAPLQSIAIALERQSQADPVLSELALAFLRAGFSIQYTTASRHPIEFIDYLRGAADKAGLQWPALAGRIVVVDAYSPHFAFIDSVHEIKTRELESIGLACIRSGMTYAGVHVAVSRAFNTLKVRMGKEYRQPTLVVYEGAYALAELESANQYRLFVRHVIPSERLWDGMLTVFLECGQPDADWSVLRGYTSLALDLRSTGNPPRRSTGAGGLASPRAPRVDPDQPTAGSRA